MAIVEIKRLGPPQYENRKGSIFVKLSHFQLPGRGLVTRPWDVAVDQQLIDKSEREAVRIGPFAF